MLTREDVRAIGPFEAVGLQLNSTLDEVEQRIRELMDSYVEAPIAPGKWSRKQIIGHLIDSASNNHQRFVRAALQGEYSGPSYDQQGCVMLADVQSMPWGLLLDLWLSYNRYLAHLIARVHAESAETPCVIGDGAPVTLQFIAQDYVRHLKHHLQQML